MSTPTVKATLDIARSQLGITEPGLGDRPGSQVTKYGHWYASWSRQTGYIDTYWCAMFASWCLAGAGFGVEQAGRFGNCNPWIKWWRRQGRWAARSAPSVGALVFYDWDGDGLAEHVGFVEALRSDGRLVTLEGNATIGGGSHDGVYRMVRSRNYVLGYGLPPYSPPAEQPGASASLSKKLPGPITILSDAEGRYGTKDARAVPWTRCPAMPRGFGGKENLPQRLWAAYWYRLMATYSPGYFKKILADPDGRAEVAGVEIGRTTVAVVEQMTHQALGNKAKPFRGVITVDAWRVFQPDRW